MDPKNYKMTKISFPPDYDSLDIEVKTFLVLMHINKKMNYREVFSKRMKKIRAMLSFLEKKVKEVIPEVYQKIINTGLPFQVFFDSYFFTLMMYRSPLEFSVRILDIFLLEGEGSLE